MLLLVRILLIGLVLAAAPLAPATGWAQTAGEEQAEPINYDDWEKVAVRAEEALETARASTDALETLRATIVRWRERFLAAQGTNSARIATLRDQIKAL